MPSSVPIYERQHCTALHYDEDQISTGIKYLVYLVIVMTTYYENHNNIIIDGWSKIKKFLLTNIIF